jgi:hypothetical protein
MKTRIRRFLSARCSRSRQNVSQSLKRALVVLIYGGGIVGGCASTTHPPAADSPLGKSTQLRSDETLSKRGHGELSTYHRDLKYVCDESGTRDADEMRRRYEALVKAMHDADYGFGRSSNFAGVPRPECRGLRGGTY